MAVKVVIDKVLLAMVYVNSPFKPINYLEIVCGGCQNQDNQDLRMYRIVICRFSVNS